VEKVALTACTAPLYASTSISPGTNYILLGSVRCTVAGLPSPQDTQQQEVSVWSQSCKYSTLAGWLAVTWLPGEPDR